MKRLHLLRHAKAVSKDAAADFDRALAPHGRDAMGRIAHHLAEAHTRIDLALVSPAARTRETWLLAKLPGVPIRFDQRIYEGSAEALLALIQEADANAKSVVLVGHNPGIHELARRLVGFGDRHAAVRTLEEFPTGSLATFEMAIDGWNEADFGTGRLVEFVTPASLGGPDD